MSAGRVGARGARSCPSARGEAIAFDRHAADRRMEIRHPGVLQIVATRAPGASELVRPCHSRQPSARPARAGGAFPPAWRGEVMASQIAEFDSGSHRVPKAGQGVP